MPARIADAYLALPDGRRACLVLLDTFWKDEGAFTVEIANETHEEACLLGTWRISSHDEAPSALSLEADTDLDDVADAAVVNELLKVLLASHGDSWGFEAAEEYVP